jgi:hypothetical protein
MGGGMKLYYFDESEFYRNDRNWFQDCSPRLLVLLDTFRHTTGTCIISPHPLAIGRVDYEKNPDSYHNYDVYGEVQAIDVFPSIPHWMEVEKAKDIWVREAKHIGFTGIGIYNKWTYNGEARPGMHLDVRGSSSPSNPVVWGINE